MVRAGQYSEGGDKLAIVGGVPSRSILGLTMSDTFIITLWENQKEK